MHGKLRRLEDLGGHAATPAPDLRPCAAVQGAQRAGDDSRGRAEPGAGETD